MKEPFCLDMSDALPSLYYCEESLRLSPIPGLLSTILYEEHGSSCTLIAFNLKLQTIPREIFSVFLFALCLDSAFLVSGADVLVHLESPECMRNIGIQDRSGV